MKTSCILILATLCISTVAHSQGFVNLNFEDAVVQPLPPDNIFLEWSLAAPGWNHSGGFSTSFVYYHQEHVGSEQIFLLVDSTSPVSPPGAQLAGNYSLAFASGVSNDVSGIWVNAYISQSGLIPSSARSIRMLASGAPFQVFIGGVEIPMLSLGGNSYGGDISGLGDSTADLTIVNAASIGNVHDYTIVDNIQFSPEAIPEPSVIALIFIGGGVLIYARRSHRRHLLV